MARIVVEVAADGPERPAAGGRVRVELRDTSIADAPSVTLASASGQVRGAPGTLLETLELTISHVPPGCTMWAHVAYRKATS